MDPLPITVNKMQQPGYFAKMFYGLWHDSQFVICSLCSTLLPFLLQAKALHFTSCWHTFSFSNTPRLEFDLTRSRRVWSHLGMFGGHGDTKRDQSGGLEDDSSMFGDIIFDSMDMSDCIVSFSCVVKSTVWFLGIDTMHRLDRSTTGQIDIGSHGCRRSHLGLFPNCSFENRWNYSLLAYRIHNDFIWISTAMDSNCCNVCQRRE